ncbi:MAG: dihydrofolate reductase family protein [Burkholderiales bacterium]
MRRVRYFAASSLDGYIARGDGSIGWLFHDADYGYAAFYSAIDTVLMGRTTYELALVLGPYPFSGKKAFVFSRSRAGTRDEHAEFVAPDVRAFVAGLRAQPGRDIWLVGGSQLAHAFLAADLIDEYIVSIHPVLLGAGIPLFPANAREAVLRFEGARTFPSGLVQLRYERTGRG